MVDDGKGIIAGCLSRNRIPAQPITGEKQAETVQGIVRGRNWRQVRRISGAFRIRKIRITPMECTTENQDRLPTVED